MDCRVIKIKWKTVQKSIIGWLIWSIEDVQIIRIKDIQIIKFNSKLELELEETVVKAITLITKYNNFMIFIPLLFI